MLDLIGESEGQLKAKIKDRNQFGVSRQEIEELLKIGVEGAHNAVTEPSEINKLFWIITHLLNLTIVLLFKNFV